MNIKSGITEAMIIQAFVSIGIIASQLIQNHAVSDAAVTGLVTAVVPLVLRTLHKRKGG